MMLLSTQPKVFLVFLALPILAAHASAWAAPVSTLVVNEKAKQCAMVFGGDECSDCVPENSEWKAVERGKGQGCPQGYEMVRVELQRRCWPFKKTHCCTKGHSGVQGDCEDMVINDELKKCAFVDDIKSCDLPPGWRKNPQGIPTKEWECPYTWDQVECLKSK
jgi:hypothetical protein